MLEVKSRSFVAPSPPMSAGVSEPACGPSRGFCSVGGVASKMTPSELETRNSPALFVAFMCTKYCWPWVMVSCGRLCTPNGSTSRHCPSGTPVSRGLHVLASAVPTVRQNWYARRPPSVLSASWKPFHCQDGTFTPV